MTLDGVTENAGTDQQTAWKKIHRTPSSHYRRRSSPVLKKFLLAGEMKKIR